MTHSKKSQNKKAAMDREYEEKRLRNNDAVKKSREKARKKSQQVSQRIKLLRNENDSLEEKKKLLRKELAMLKEMFLAYNGSGKCFFLQSVVSTNYSYNREFAV